MALLDIDKIISYNNKTIYENDNRMQSMRMAADLSGLKGNFLPSTIREPTPEPM